jgi:hypothetical protein
MARRRRQGRFASRAALEALLRFGPQVSGLTELQRAAEDQFSSSVKGARAAARGTVQAVRAARPQVRDVYHDAAHASKDIAQVIGPNMAGVPASLQAAIAQEQTGFGNRLQESKAAALTDLTSRGVAAREGKGAAIRAARDDFAGQLQQILRQRIDLAGQQGAFQALRQGELRDEAQKRADQFALKQMGLTQEERNSLRSSGLDPDTGKPIPGGKLDPTTKGKGKGKGSRATEEQIGNAQDAVQLAIHEARTLQHLGATRGEIAEMLTSGAKDQEIALHNPQSGKALYWKAGEKGNEDGSKTGQPKTRKVPGVPQIKSQLLLSAALDHIFSGYVSRQNERRLHSRGLWVRDLDLLTHHQYRRKHRPRPHGGRPSQGAAGYPFGPGSGQVH